MSDNRDDTVWLGATVLLGFGVAHDELVLSLVACGLYLWWLIWGRR